MAISPSRLSLVWAAFAEGIAAKQGTKLPFWPKKSHKFGCKSAREVFRNSLRGWTVAQCCELYALPSVQPGVVSLLYPGLLGAALPCPFCVGFYFWGAEAAQEAGMWLSRFMAPRNSRGSWLDPLLITSFRGGSPEVYSSGLPSSPNPSWLPEKEQLSIRAFSCSAPEHEGKTSQEDRGEKSSWICVSCGKGSINQGFSCIAAFPHSRAFPRRSSASLQTSWKR